MLGLEKSLLYMDLIIFTKTLSFTYMTYAMLKQKREQEDYIQYIDEQYNSERLTKYSAT